MSAKPTLYATAGAPELELAAAGAWTATHAGELEKLVDDASSGLAHGDASIDMHKVEAFDTYGAWLLERLIRERRARGGETTIVALPEHYRDLVTAMHDASQDAPQTHAKENPITSSVEKLGKTLAGHGDDLLAIANMLGAIGEATVRIIMHPRRFRFTSAVHHLDRVGLQAVPIILLITFLIGGIISQHGFFHFR